MSISEILALIECYLSKIFSPNNIVIVIGLYLIFMILFIVILTVVRKKILKKDNYKIKWNSFKKFLIVGSVFFLIVGGIFLFSQSPHFIIKRNVPKICEKYGLEFTQLDLHIEADENYNIYDGMDLKCSINIYCNGFSKLSKSEKNEFRHDINYINNHSILYTFYTSQSNSYIYSGGDEYCMEPVKENDYNYNGNSSTTGSVTCPNCNGTGYVKYYSSGSNLESFLEGVEAYTTGSCTMCDGTGKTN